MLCHGYVMDRVRIFSRERGSPLTTAAVLGVSWGCSDPGSRHQFYALFGRPDLRAKHCGHW